MCSARGMQRRRYLNRNASSHDAYCDCNGMSIVVCMASKGVCWSDAHDAMRNMFFWF